MLCKDGLRLYTRLIFLFVDKSRSKNVLSKTFTLRLYEINSNVSKLCSVASDESFVSFLYINELYRKKACFLQQEEVFLFCKFGTKYSRMGQVKFVEDSLQKF